MRKICASSPIYLFIQLFNVNMNLYIFILYFVFYTQLRL